MIVRKKVTSKTNDYEPDQDLIEIITKKVEQRQALRKQMAQAVAAQTLTKEQFVRYQIALSY